MTPIFSLFEIKKSFGSKVLFESLSLGVHQGDQIAILGGNGAGKSTLLKIIAGREPPDSGQVHTKKNLKISYVPQSQVFPEHLTATAWILEQLKIADPKNLSEHEIQASIGLSMAGFEDPDIVISHLSGGWRKRLSLALAIAYEPELLLLDEPTNHLDWDGILWFEDWVRSYQGTFVLISHDRQLLKNLCHRFVEINPAFPQGALSFECSYEDFQSQKEAFLDAQMNQEARLSNKAKRELEWLRAGVKARTTKSVSRAKKAHAMLDDLQTLKSKNRSAKEASRIQVDATQRLAKKLIELKDVDVGYDSTVLIRQLNMTLGPKTCLGILGQNGSGKTSLLKLFLETLRPLSGVINKAEQLKTVYFEQNRAELPLEKNLMQYLADGGDYVLFQNNSIHVASYAARFLFRSEKMGLPIAQLSGGEQARLLLAKILLQPADILIFDEPTNDLDIETIEVLETMLREFPGLSILVSHDREFMTELCDVFLGLNGNGEWAFYASLDQWLNRPKTVIVAEPRGATPEQPSTKGPKTQLSYKEKRFLDSVESDIAKIEEDLNQNTELLAKPEVIANHVRFAEVAKVVEGLQKKLDDLYSQWATLESKKGD